MHPNHMRLVAVAPLRVKDLLDRKEVMLVDVREVDEWDLERIPGAIHMPLSQFEPAELPRIAGSSLVLHCLAGARSPKAADILFRSGSIDVMHMHGGLTGWKLAGLPTVKPSSSRRNA